MVDASKLSTNHKIPTYFLVQRIYFFKTIGITNACEKLIMRMRVKAFENVLRQPVFWFDLKNSSPGNLITRLARDAPIVKSVSIF